MVPLSVDGSCAYPREQHGIPLCSTTTNSQHFRTFPCRGCCTPTRHPKGLAHKKRRAEMERETSRKGELNGSPISPCQPTSTLLLPSFQTLWEQSWNNGLVIHSKNESHVNEQSEITQLAHVLTGTRKAFQDKTCRSKIYKQKRRGQTFVKKNKAYKDI